MIYAPVIIPTLNRYEHFKNCLDSLAKCTWAEKTDVFIGVDHPFKEEHIPGNKKIKEYLENFDSTKFKSLNVVFREINYYICGKGNAKSLREEVFKTFDRCIFSEDDNVFSPNFLVYINRGLELFKEDPTVLAISGYRHYYPVKFGNNTYFRQNVDFSAWGYGIMRDKFNEKVMQISPEYFRSKMSLVNFLKVYNNGNSHTAQFLHQAYEKHPYRSDFVIGVMMALEGMDVVMPRLSLVRNMGWDGSGLNCNSERKKEARLHSMQEISEETDFEFVGTGKEYYKENHNIYIESSYEKKSLLYLLKVIMNFLIKTILRNLHFMK